MLTDEDQLSDANSSLYYAGLDCVHCAIFYVVIDSVPTAAVLFPAEFC